MKDLIAKLQLDANCALGAIWMHIDAQAARIAELEAQIAAKADTDKQAWSHITPRDFVDVATAIMDQHGLMDDLSYAKTEKLCEDMEASFKKLPHPMQAPVREVPEGMPVSQEPKYGIRENRLFNRASGETIPEDEPVFIFRARDTHVVNILAGYAREVLNAEHASAVWGRVDDFKRFWDANPDRMKQPDTALPAAPVQQEGE